MVIINYFIHTIQSLIGKDLWINVYNLDYHNYKNDCMMINDKIIIYHNTHTDDSMIIKIELCWYFVDKCCCFFNNNFKPLTLYEYAMFFFSKKIIILYLVYNHGHRSLSSTRKKKLFVAQNRLMNFFFLFCSCVYDKEEEINK